MTKVTELHRKWLEEPRYKAEFDSLSDEFELARTLIAARTHAGLSQSELARRMKTSQSYVARIESGRIKPSTEALHRFARAIGSRLRISFEPDQAR